MESLLVLSHESITCCICCEILEHPLECNNCHNLFCNNCIKEYLDTKDKYRRTFFCPLCRNKKNSFKENSKIDNILQEYKISGKIVCNKCKNVTEKEKYKEHANKCWYKCIKCHKLFINEDTFINHFSNHGKNELTKILNSLFNGKTRLIKKINEEKNEIDFGKIKREKYENNLNIDNKNNQKMILIDMVDYNPKYNLFFCGKENNIKCKCCSNKKCSPNGELCINCMKKNQKYHGLKKHYLINKKGKACKYSKNNFHCNSKFEIINEDNGGNFYKIEKICKDDYTCDACKNITELMNYYLPTQVIKKLIERDL